MIPGFRVIRVLLLLQALLLAGKAPALGADRDCGLFLLGGELSRNPLVLNSKTIHWDQITPSHFVPALRHQLDEFQARFSRILSDPAEPTFENTVLAVEFASSSFSRTFDVYSILSLNHSTPELLAIQADMNQIGNEYTDLIMQSEEYFRRVARVYEALKSGTEEFEITKGVYEGFLERGIALGAAEREELSRIHRRLGELGDQFENHRMIEENSIRLKVKDLRELGGLPSKWLEFVKQSKDANGVYWIPLKNHTLITQIMENVRVESFLKKVFFAGSSRAIAEKYITAEEAGAAWTVDNRPVLLEILSLRQRLSKILGHQTYAEGVLKDRMAGSPDRVRQFYADLLPGVQALAEQEKADLLKFAKNFDPMTREVKPWNRARFVKWLYEDRFRLEQDKISEFFEVNRTVQSVFDFYSDLFRIRFEKIAGAKSWLPEVEVYRIMDEESGQELSQLHVDLYARETKSPGAWKASIQKAGVNEEGVRQTSIMEITLNLDRAPGGAPTLMRIGEVNTLFHELGHAMHEAFSKTRYQVLAGTSVTRDFVEFPSQIMENWLYTPEFLKKGAIHYRTGRPMPEDWIQRIQEADRFRMGTYLRRQMMLGMIDFHWHTSVEDLAGASPERVDEFEKALYDSNGVERLPEFTPFSPSFGHIFSGGYAMGYYSYLWGNVIEADGFEYWISDPSQIKEKALALKHLVLSQGGTRDPNELYRAWTGRDYSTAPFLKRSGLR